MERIMRQDSNLSPYDGFRIGGIGKVLNQIGLNQETSHHLQSEFRKEYIEIPRIFKEFAKVMTPDPIRIPRIGGVDLVIKDHPVLERTLSTRTEFSSRMSFSEDRIMGYRGKERELIKTFTPQEIRQPVIGRYEGMLEIAGHEILVAGVAGKENGSMTLGNKIEATLKVKEECKYEYVRYKPIQMNMEDKKDMQMIIKEHINLGLIEPGVSAYSSPGILIDETGIELQEHIVEKIRNFPDVLKDKKHLQSFLGVVNFAGIFIKDLAKYRKDFRPLLGETESSKWKWEEIHTQRVRELKQVCSNLPKLAIPQDEDELVVYTDANDYRWAAVLIKKTTTGEEPCRYTGGLFSEQQAQVWHINEKEFFAVWKAFKKWPLFLLAKEFTLKVDNTNVKAFLKNKLE
ncbi:UNVERIFIED_CONTAM: putative enzymatic polyprotein [Sesamum radiatum]|uniref:Enzymatic polyprotein n=1 Tax=Sesamum radiatum TaxID=300843 RepID=A0AAW2S325_SESRA